MFKVGDKVRVNWEKTNYINCYGTDMGTIVDTNYYGRGGIGVRISLGETTLGFYPEELELINKNTIMSSIKEKFVSAFLAEPEKTFRKAGVTNGDGFLTSEGQEIFMSFLLKKHGDEFKKEVVDELVKEEK